MLLLTSKCGLFSLATPLYLPSILSPSVDPTLALYLHRYVNSLEMERSDGTPECRAHAKVQECKDLELTWTREHVYLYWLAKGRVAGGNLQIITVFRVGREDSKSQNCSGI